MRGKVPDASSWHRIAMFEDDEDRARSVKNTLAEQTLTHYEANAGVLFYRKMCAPQQSTRRGQSRHSS
jgi:hypothetical protein